MKKNNNLLIVFTALLIILSFFLPWWRTWNDVHDGWMSGWHRATDRAQNYYISFDDYGRVADVGRAPAPILYIYFVSTIGCLLTGYLSLWEKIPSKTSAVILALLSGCNLAILAYLLYTDRTDPLLRVINVALPLFWRAMYGLYGAILLNIYLLALGIHRIKQEQKIKTDLILQGEIPTSS